MRSRSRLLSTVAAAGALGLAVAATVGAAPGTAASVPAAKAMGLSSNGLFLSTFSLDAPGAGTLLGKVKGLSGDTKLIGIDQRIQDRKVYGVGNAGGVYTLSQTSSAVVKVSQLTVALSGSAFDIDFNPAADRLRVISDTGQNLRHDVNPGGATTVDGTLAYVPGTPATGITAGGYTNNDLATTTGTVLFDIDINLDQVAAQIPANDGTLSVMGPLGANATAMAGLDVLTVTKGGVATSNVGYAALRMSGEYMASLHTIDLLTGAATRVGNFANPADTADIAVIQPVEAS